MIDWCHVTDYVCWQFRFVTFKNGGSLVSKDTGSEVKSVFITSSTSKYFPYEMGYSYIDKEDETLGGANRQ